MDRIRTRARWMAVFALGIAVMFCIAFGVVLLAAFSS